MKALITTLLALISISVFAEGNSSDTTKFKVNNTKVIIINSEDDGDTVIVSSDTLDIDSSDKKKKYEAGENKHWAGIDIGFNGLLSPSNSLSLGPQNDFLRLNYSRSINWSLNIAERDIRIAGEYVKLVSGLGFQFYNYEFEKNYTMQSRQDSIVAVLDTVNNFTKNRLKASFINVPLLLAFNTNKDEDEGLRLAVGVIFGYKLGSRTKQVFERNDDKIKPVVKGNFNMNPFQMVSTVRIGYKGLNFYGNYNLNPLFIKNEGPEVTPFSLGLSFLI